MGIFDSIQWAFFILHNFFDHVIRNEKLPPRAGSKFCFYIWAFGASRREIEFCQLSEPLNRINTSVVKIGSPASRSCCLFWALLTLLKTIAIRLFSRPKNIFTCFFFLSRSASTNKRLVSFTSIHPCQSFRIGKVFFLLSQCTSNFKYLLQMLNLVFFSWTINSYSPWDVTTSATMDTSRQTQPDKASV